MSSAGTNIEMGRIYILNLAYLSGLGLVGDVIMYTIAPFISVTSCDPCLVGSVNSKPDNYKICI